MSALARKFMSSQWLCYCCYVVVCCVANGDELALGDVVAFAETIARQAGAEVSRAFADRGGKHEIVLCQLAG